MELERKSYKINLVISYVQIVLKAQSQCGFPRYPPSSSTRTWLSCFNIPHSRCMKRQDCANIFKDMLTYNPFNFVHLCQQVEWGNGGAGVLNYVTIICFSQRQYDMHFLPLLLLSLSLLLHYEMRAYTRLLKANPNPNEITLTQNMPFISVTSDKLHELKSPLNIRAPLYY